MGRDKDHCIGFGDTPVWMILSLEGKVWPTPTDSFSWVAGSRFCGNLALPKAG